MATPQTQRTASPAPSLTRYAWLSIAAAIVTIGLKTYAYLLRFLESSQSHLILNILNQVSKRTIAASLFYFSNIYWYLVQKILVHSETFSAV